ncbi:hypothetical protein ACPEIC_25755 [Stenotrophomonas sp. NPDC087984]
MGEDRWRNHVTGGIDGKRYTAQEAPARVMQKHERGAEAYLGEDVTDGAADRGAADGTVTRWGAGGRGAGGWPVTAGADEAR